MKPLRLHIWDLYYFADNNKLCCVLQTEEKKYELKVKLKIYMLIIHSTNAWHSTFDETV